ncbi:protoporphyrinogen oxidase [Sporosarcina ureilytica]|uniref:Coproporphyrinogen III oxidase n=1 Tax=Sporosarcina ureilytica TaxID=298596 RepID=A0A1D8JJ17_9BACL|nr:protoporphyrinogen oxidase [Sporosarcina ureilytica]AOV08680.1 protoporphyrinogen oxidase [Sporosarcina ureilytica]
MEKPCKKVIIIGGGITGLSAAFYTKKLFDEQQIPVDITLIEKSEELGGKIQTLRKDGFIIERGPDAFLARKLPIITLTKELGLEDELIGTNPNARTNYIYHKKKLHQMPLGLVLGIPTKLTPFMKTGLISPIGKLRASLDLLLPKKKILEDESLGHFIQRRLGKEVLENITEPLLGGIYAGDTDTLSLQATFPNLVEMEQKHRSLILGMAAGMKNRPASVNLPDAAKKSMFLTYKNGMSTLIEALKETLKSIRIIKGQGVTKVDQRDNGYQVHLDDQTKLHADGIVFALPNHHAASLLSDVESIHLLEKVNYVSVANVSLTFDKADITYPMNGTGFLIPANEGTVLTACTWSSSKWLHAAPENKYLLRCYVGREKDQQWVKWSDEEILANVQKDLKDIMGITATPTSHTITRAIHSMPQYPIHHLEQLKKVRKCLKAQKPGLFLCGAGYEGVGIPDCIEQGKRAAEKMVAYLAVN